MIPKINRNATYTVNIPSLTGGVNLRDEKSLVGDTQLTECGNVWYKHGALRTRPNIKVDKSLSTITDFSNVTDDTTIDILTDPANTAVINGKRYALEVIVRKEALEATYQSITIRYVRAEDVIDLGYIIAAPNTAATELNAYAVQHNGDVYVYVHYYDFFEPRNYNEVYKIERIAEGVYNSPTKQTPYAPLILTNCVSTYGENVLPNAPTRNATQVEGFNLLGNKYRIIASAFDYTEGGTAVKIDDNITISWLQFALPYTANASYPDDTIEIDINYGSGTTRRHKVTVPTMGQVNYESTKGADGYYANCWFSKNGVCMVNLSREQGSIDPAEYDSSDHIHNNITITAPCINPVENAEKVTRMTRATWYGNTSLGLNGGSRLFLGGNEADNEKALVVWSDFENPLYFSENNYAYVGDKAQRVTAFGKQGSSLIIFKERETYSTQYVQGEVTGEELTEQSALDVTTRLAQFPMVLIHAYIGCDLPDSIQLCRNRLVWACKSGKLYTMTAQSQYSERNVFEIGQMLESKLKQCDLSKAYSIDYEGHYVLIADRHAFLLDYNSSGFANISSYGKHDDANMLIPCYIWHFSEDIVQAIMIDEEPLLFTRGHTSSDKGTTYLTYFGNEDTDRGSLTSTLIECSAQTKVFVFNQSRNVVIPSVNVGIGNTNTPVSVQVVTDALENDTHTVVGNVFSMAKEILNRITERCIKPYTHVCGRVGIRFSCKGKMEIYGVSISYRQAGGKR